MSAKKSFITFFLAVGLVAGGTVAPANAVGTVNGKCTYYDSFVGTSSRRGNSSTAGQKKLCGNVKVRVGYNVSGGTALYTSWKSGSGLVIQGPVGYQVFGGEHTVSNPTLGAYPKLVRS